MEIIIDTETTGLTRLSYANRLNYKQWPRMVQIAWALIDEGAIQIQRSIIALPDNYTIPASATQIHGITHDVALASGIPAIQILQQLNEAFRKCDRVIAHNLQFDLGILESEALRHDFPLDLPAKRTCTVHLGRHFLTKHAGIKQGGYPKLSSLYERLFGFGFANPHNASADVTACFHVYKKLKQLGFSD